MHISLFLVFTFLVIITPNYAQRGRPQGRPQGLCVTPDNLYGNCVTLSYCPQVANIFTEVDQQYAQQYLFALQRACGTRSIRGDPVVCCTRPQTAPVTERPTTTAANPFLNRPTQATRPQSRETTTQSVAEDKAGLIDTRGSYCRGPDTKEGVCVTIAQCPTLLNALQSRPSDESFKNFLRASNTVCGGVGSMVCCPSTGSSQPVISTPSTVTQPAVSVPVNTNGVPRRFPTVEEGCGIASNSYRKIVGGKVSKKGAWPWAALLGYNDGLSTTFKCGATLVSARHVVTAAHCVVKGLSIVRLGEHDLSTDTETVHVDVPIANVVAHPEYQRNTGRNDIAFITLARNVAFTDTIKPICLPVTEEQRSKSYVGFTPFVVGWGKTMEGGYSSDVLQELQIPVYENSVCQSAYTKAKRFFASNQFDDTVMCAGILSGGKDTCQGDSGGPLMFPEQYPTQVRFYLIGVVSYGIGCARPEIPGVYSNVAYHMDWLNQRVSETP